ncbi:MAG: 2-isopropylmalate synthase [Marinobacter sp.]|uniref:2-isopropylmalate synthase n=1 Tax=Marinobacter sp. TaxID=50741 RepID=UPI003F99B526
MIQTEAQRQFYLGVAGIRLWYAREPLPGAAPSPEFQFPEPDEAVRQPVLGEVPVAAVSAKAKVSRSSSEANQRGIQRIASLQALMESKAEPVPTKTSEEQWPPEVSDRALEDPAEDNVAPAQESQANTTEVLRLNMGVFIGQRHILVAHISKEASLRLQETLATNILKSLGEDQLGAAKWIHWPVFNNLLVPGSSLADLKSVMAQVLDGVGSKKMIVLGPLEGTRADSGWLADVVERAPDIASEHSLAELASNPDLKRSLWQQLKSLVAR